jgi:hypothetical protein
MMSRGLGWMQHFLLNAVPLCHDIENTVPLGALVLPLAHPQPHQAPQRHQGLRAEPVDQPVEVLAHLMDFVGIRRGVHSESIPPLTTALPPRSAPVLAWARRVGASPASEGRQRARGWR